jgi:SAM-dependent methyltransferase
MLSRALGSIFNKDIHDCKVLDVGCGTGEFLRQLVEWGVDPANCLGTEYLENCLERAKKISPKEIYYHLGSLDFDGKIYGEQFNLVSAHTVFSSILDDYERESLATEMWSKVCGGGFIMIFDFHYNNPSNPDVRKVTKKELASWWQGSEKVYFTDSLIPPLARKIIGGNYLMAEMLTTLFPFLRSHFVYMVRKQENK